MKFRVPGKYGGWWLAMSWQKESRWKYFSIWHEGPFRALWIGHFVIEWWWA